MCTHIIISTLTRCRCSLVLAIWPLLHFRDSAMKAAQNKVKSGPSSPRSPSPPVGNQRAVLYSAWKSFGETPPLKVKIECDSVRVSLCPCFYPRLFCLHYFYSPSPSFCLLPSQFPTSSLCLFSLLFFASSLNLTHSVTNESPPNDTNVSICCF